LLSEYALQTTQRQASCGMQRASALRFTNPTVQAFLPVLLMFRFMV
jgi:hypothetical protein